MQLKNSELQSRVVIQALEALLKKFSELNDDPSKNRSAFMMKDTKVDDWSTLAEKRLKSLSARLSTLEHSASQIAPEIANFQAQLQSLLEEFDERKRAGQSPSLAIDKNFRERLLKLRDSVARTAIYASNREVVCS
ncbi:unnamed protein product [Anisakis simplex]|uniref:SKA2 domain-containing protein n=1 Tax=Anisakis simplex TaxID=6269 RepID=A0A0M3JFR4_ANISI|nr:unnamed protein product [Anisakis simplex]